jgi:hypothetical protein
LLIEQFEKVIAAPGWERALKSTNQQLRELTAQTDNDIDFFIEKCKKGPGQGPQKIDFAANGVAAGGYKHNKGDKQL